MKYSLLYYNLIRLTEVEFRSMNGFLRLLIFSKECQPTQPGTFANTHKVFIKGIRESLRLFADPKNYVLGNCNAPTEQISDYNRLIIRIKTRTPAAHTL